MSRLLVVATWSALHCACVPRPALAPTPLEAAAAPGLVARGSIASHAPQDDGEPLAVASVAIEVLVVGGVARTRVTQVFRNHRDTETAGTCEIALPLGAAIGRLVMDGRSLLPSEHGGQEDPFTRPTERLGRGHVRMAIDGIPAGGTMTVEVDYEQVLAVDPAARRYRYWLPPRARSAGAITQPRIGRLAFTLEADHMGAAVVAGYEAFVQHGEGRTRVHFEASEFLPAGPLEVSFLRAASSEATIAFGGRGEERRFLVQLLPHFDPAGAFAPQDLVLALDTSASLRPPAMEQLRRVAVGLLEATRPRARVAVVHGAVLPSVCGDGLMARAESRTLRDCVAGLHAGGATDLERLLRRAVAVAREAGRAAAVVLVSDGRPSMGEQSPVRIRARTIEEVGDAPVAIHAVAIGRDPGTHLLRSLAHDGRGRMARLAPSGDAAALVALVEARLAEPLLSDVRVDVVAGRATVREPAQPVHLARGEPLTIVGRLGGEAARLQIKGRRAGEAFERLVVLNRPDEATDGLVWPLWARTREREDAGTPTRMGLAALRDGITPDDPATAMQIALARKGHYVELRERWREPSDAERRIPTDTWDSAVDTEAGATSGRNGFRVRVGGGPMHAWAGPDPILADGLQRALRRRLGPLAECYEGVLRDHPDARGRLELRLAFASNGRLQRARVADAGAGAEGLGACALGVVRTLRVPPTEAGGFAVSYPLVFSYAGDPPLSAERAAARVQVLDAASEPLGTDELAELLWLLLSIGKTGAAAQRLAEHRARLPAEEVPRGLYPLFEAPTVRLHFPDGYVQAAVDRLDHLGGDDAVEAALWHHLEQVGDEEAFLRVVGARRLGARQAAKLVKRLVVGGCGTRARALADAWVASGAWPDAELYRVFTSTGWVAEVLGEPAFVLAERLVGGGVWRPEVGPDVGDHFVHMGIALGRVERVADELVRLCAEPSADPGQCRAWLAQVAPHPRATALGAELEGAHAAQLERRRQHDMADCTLVRELAALLAPRSDDATVLRVLSEMVEFDPHEPDARLELAEALAEYGHAAEACAQYADALWLEPTSPDYLEEMSRLRAIPGANPDAIRRCVVDAVARLPVSLDATAVVTWDDAEADVDLVVDEPGGAVVSPLLPASESDGLLYHDATDGHGPEVYLLGRARPGEYALSVVYRRGPAPVVRGNLTLVRRPGTTHETRQEFPFTLRADHGPPEPLTVLRY